MIGSYNILEITRDFKQMLLSSQEYPFELHVDNLINQWYEAKKQFIAKFGGRTIVRLPQEITLSDIEIHKEQSRGLLLALDEQGLLTEALKSFLENNKDTLCDNIVSFGPFKGEKIVKAFRHFIHNLEDLEVAQIIASRYIQNSCSKIKGYMYLSVDPRDFLTLSDNDNNWRTCMSLDGGMRLGNLSYMVDNVTCIVYIADEYQKPLKVFCNNVQWNNKQWRCLIHVGDKATYYSKSYPYECNYLTMKAYELVSNFLVKRDKPISGYLFKVCSNPSGSNQINTGGRTYDMRDVVDASKLVGFCDLVYGNGRAVSISYNHESNRKYRLEAFKQYSDKKREEELFLKVHSIKVGDLPLCPCCGKNFSHLESSFLCDDCIDKYNAHKDFFNSCNECGHRICEQDQYYCKKCYKKIKIKFGQKEIKSFNNI